MQRSGLVLPFAALTLFILAVILPLTVGFASVLWDDVDQSIRSAGQSFMPARPLSELLLTSTGWAIGVAIASMVLGWAPGRLLARRTRVRSIWLGVAFLLLLPLCLPPYAIFWSWWQTWPVGTWLHRWAIEHQLVTTFRLATLGIGMVCWSWPLAAWCVAAASDRSAREHDLQRIDGARWWHRLPSAWRGDARGLLLGGLVVFTLTFNNTTCFDLAEVFTFGNELRAMEAMGVTTADILWAALPAVLLAAFLAIAVWLTLKGALREHATHDRAPTSSLRSAAFPLGLWLLSIALPAWLVVSGMQRMFVAGGVGEQVAQFFDFYGIALLGSAVVAVGTAALIVVVALGMAMMWDDRRPWIRWLAHVQAVLWLLVAALPGTIVGLSIAQTYNTPWLGIDRILHTSGGSLALGMIARFGVIGVLLGRWLSTREPQMLRELRSLDGIVTLPAYVRATWPRLAGIGAATFVVTGVLALSEIPVTAVLRPARMLGGLEIITPSILNAMHYQQPRTVILAIACFLITAIIAAAVLLIVPRMLSFRTARTTVLLLACTVALLLLPGCDESETPALRTTNVFGSAGMSLGQMSYPRGMAIDVEREFVYIMDKTARVQRYGFDGTPLMEWAMPEKANGQPVGLKVDPQGRVWVADTHYHRVIAYDQNGDEVMRIGSYGEGPGQFVYVTDLEFGSDGSIYVAEYGGNDRVQVFDPQGRYLFEFGSFGAMPGEYNRPQAIKFNSDRTELYIADACNHRIVVTDERGMVLRHFGKPGREPGLLGYPYGLALLPDGSILVSEFGNSRVQRFSSSGESLGVSGGAGYEIGRLLHPWSVAADGTRVFVLDSGNNRVQVVDRFR